ncbi:hypothetical protein [Ascidiimonas sp. W6]|uniref:hypothetical protein n=1 Tax=Ascidiimonas meishanensis TaxID=3128903 RepID=UPI0030EDBBF4
MKNLSFVIIIICIVSLCSCHKELTCEDFKIGTFIIPSDSISDFKHTIIRTSKYQLEYPKGTEDKEVVYGKLEWIDECSYRITYDESMGKLNETQRVINRNNGILINSIKIEENCMEIMMTLSLSNGENIEQIGKICKE